MESYSRPEVKETLVNNGKIYESSGNISVSSSKYVNSNETENVDLSALDGSNIDSSQIVKLDDNYNSPEKQIGLAAVEKTSKDMLKTANLVEGLILSAATAGAVGNVGNALVVYDSFHGKENEPASDFLDDLLFQTLTDQLGDTLKDLAEEREKKSAKKMFELKVNEKRETKHPWAKSLEDKFGQKAGSKYDNKYKLGKDWKYDAVDIIKKDLWNFSTDAWNAGAHTEGEWGSLDGRVRVSAFDTHGSFRVGPDHVVLDASAEYDLLNLEGAFDTPALKTKDGLEIYSAGLGGEVSILHAEAKARAGVGLVPDDEGKKHLEAGVQLKAEADLVKATASGKVTVLGVTGKATAGVKIGAGVQVDVGIVGGEVHCNLSAALGFGFEIGISVDFSKLTKYFANCVPKQKDYSCLAGSGIW